MTFENPNAKAMLIDRQRVVALQAVPSSDILRTIHSNQVSLRFPPKRLTAIQRLSLRREKTELFDHLNECLSVVVNAPFEMVMIIVERTHSMQFPRKKFRKLCLVVQRYKWMMLNPGTCRVHSSSGGIVIKNLSFIN